MHLSLLLIMVEARPPVSYTVEDAVKLVRYSSRTTHSKSTSWFGKICVTCVFRGYFRKTCTCNLYRSKHCLIHYFSLDRLLSTMSSPSKPYWHADFKGSCRIQLFTTKSGWLKKEERTTTTSSSYRQSRGRNLESSLTLLLMLPARKGAQTLLLSP